MTLTPIQNSHQAQPWGADDRYIVKHVLDSGGVGQVFLATDTQLNRSVVIKVLKEPLIENAETCQQFERAVKSCAALGGEYIAQVLDSGTNAGGCPFYVMEYLQGESLKQCLEREGKLSPQQAVGITSQICAALEMSYQSKFASLFESDEPFVIVPHELKPTQIFLTRSGPVKLLDCGLTKDIRSSCCETQGASFETLLPETFHYAAPEQLEGEEKNHLADVYVLGIILYEMLSGTDPFGLGLDSRLVREGAWIHAHAFRAPRLLQVLLMKSPVTAALSEIVNRCLAKNPCDRYASINALRQALEQVEIGAHPAPDAASDNHGDNYDQTFIQGSLDTRIKGASTQVTSTIVDHPDRSNTMQALELDETMIQASERPAPAGQALTQVVLPSAWSERSATLSDSDNAAQDLGVDETIVQYSDSVAFPPIDQTVTQIYSESSVLENHKKVSDSLEIEDAQDLGVDETIVQYLDVAIHNPADQNDDSAQVLRVDETIVQTSSPIAHFPIDQTVAQTILESNMPNSQKGRRIEGKISPGLGADETIVQYLDSAIHNPADQTVAQTIDPMDEQPLDQTLCQQNTPHIQQADLAIVRNKNKVPGRALVRNVWRSRRSVSMLFVSLPRRCFQSLRRMIDFRKWRSRPQLSAVGTERTQPSGYVSHSRGDDVQSSTEQYQKSQQELDRCRLSLAKELARNGKFRDAIATLKQIQEPSPSYPKAQKLIRSWEKY
ncbi:Serine/threonine-protein kinase PknB [Acaryochloris thomasi RCC1774]|uniref:Serine/threonine-protein kinase PknB n=1 Tax=Acaryochloris thomasi RCC1774 TaxID=1764569 RepID=A0A2W1JJQ2_9CYAN|nr:serine/threonine-protein kinase [Acaryochloris thomasi]PZD71725.1 Serine/threonine-protein kinase PknB [Acaryochloris thomasi RCC1774]